MKHLVPMCAAAAAIGFGACAAAGGAEPRVAVVDMARVVQAHPDAKDMKQFLLKMEEEFDKEKADLKKRFEEMKGEFEGLRQAMENKALNEAARDAKRAEAEEKLKELQDYEIDYRKTLSKRDKDINDMRFQMEKRIVEKVQKVVAGIAAERKLDLVLDASEFGMAGRGFVIHAAPALDITAAALEGVKAEKPSAPPAAEEPPLKP